MSKKFFLGVFHRSLSQSTRTVATGEKMKKLGQSIKKLGQSLGQSTRTVATGEKMKKLGQSTRTVIRTYTNKVLKKGFKLGLLLDLRYYIEKGGSVLIQKNNIKISSRKKI